MPNKNEIALRLFCRPPEKDITISGRLIGLVSPEQYNGCVKLVAAARRVFNYPSVDLKDIARAEDIVGMRLAISAKNINGEIVSGKKVMFTEPLEYVSEIQKNFKNIYIRTQAGSSITLKLL